MRDPGRIERMGQKLIEVWKTVPDMRLGQLISNIVGNDAFIFYVEDDKLEKAFDVHLEATEYMETH